MPFKVFCIVERSSPFGHESKILASFRNKNVAEGFKKKASNPYFAITENWAIEVGGNVYVLAQSEPIIVQ